MAAALLQVAPPAVRAFLRAETEAVHLRMHGLPAFAAIDSGQLGLADYGTLLRRLHSFHSLIGKHAGALTNAARRLDLLDEDLAWLGLERGPTLHWERPAGADARMGVAYVAQGSTLGGRVIARQLDYLLGTRADGRRFFLGSSEDAQVWLRLCGMLEEHGGSVDARLGIAEGARSAFALFEHCMDASL